MGGESVEWMTGVCRFASLSGSVFVTHKRIRMIQERAKADHPYAVRNMVGSGEATPPTPPPCSASVLFFRFCRDEKPRNFTLATYRTVTVLAEHWQRLFACYISRNRRTFCTLNKAHEARISHVKSSFGES